MNPRRLIVVFVLLCLIPVGIASADWYDDYDEGVKAARAGDWNTVISKMNAALAKQPTENARARTYGNIFIKYHPYYYLGIAHLRLGGKQNLQRSLEYLGKATGAGDFNQGSPGTLSAEADNLLRGIIEAEGRARQRAESAISDAMQKMTEAQSAGAPQSAKDKFNQGASLIREANNARSNANTTEAWQSIEDKARQAVSVFGEAILDARLAATQPTPAQPRPTPTPVQQPPVQQPTPTPVQQTPVQPRPTPVQQPPIQRPVEQPVDTSRPIRDRLKDALQSYFAGDFSVSARQLSAIAEERSNNAMVWAFLGAANYYDYYMGGERNAQALEQAKQALSRAKRINPSLELDRRYFSQRFRDFYSTVN